MKRPFFPIFVAALLAGPAPAEEFASHPPMRPLPQPSDRQLPEDARLRFVNPDSGADENDGSQAKPWKTVAHAVQQLRAGDTLVLSGGVYHEHVVIRNRGELEKPITIRSAPGELAILDGGLPEFLDSPETAWQPAEDGAPDEFVSAKTYPSLGEKDGQTNLLGAFADSMIPLHGYRYLTDLRSPNEYFAATAGGKTEADKHIYCGPGLWYNPETERIHVRLSHTSQTCLESTDDNYKGETDPRKIPLIVARKGQSTLLLEKAANIVLQDLAIRGSRDDTLNIVESANITLDGVFSYGGKSAMRLESTRGLRCVNSAFRGIAAPWTWRGSLKYRAIEARIVSASSWNPPARGNADFEFAQCEFTDCVDGVFIGNVEGATFQNCLLDNLSDDGFFITCRASYDGQTRGGDFAFANNRLSRNLTTFAFGVGHGRQRTIDDRGSKQLGAGTKVYGNIFDFRRPVHYQQPAEGDPDIITFGRILGDHGGPGWEPIKFVGNVVVSPGPAWRNYFAYGLAQGMGKGTNRQVFGNVFFQFEGAPGQVLPPEGAEFEFVDNIHWSAELGEAGAETWKLEDRYEKPEFGDHSRDFREPLALGPDTANVRVGVRGRLTIAGAEAEPIQETPGLTPLPKVESQLNGKRAALVLGYPAFDAPIVEFILEKAGYEVDVFDKIWLPVDDYENYETIVITGDSVRAKMEPSGLQPDEFPKVRAWMDNGGNLVLMRGNARQFYPGDAGRAELESITGSLPRGTPYEPALDLKHPWLESLASLPKPESPPAAAEDDPLAALDRDPLAKPEKKPKSEIEEEPFDPLAWIRAKNLTPLPMPNAENAIASEKGMSILGRVELGKGSLTHIGWIPSQSLPHGRLPSTVEQEAAYEAQYRVLEKALLAE